jgi:fructose 5-dehydrogenase cytochrome subunit
MGDMSGLNDAPARTPFEEVDLLRGSPEEYFSVGSSENSNNLIATILNGVDRTSSKRHAYMPGFAGKPSDINALSDNEIALLANYVIKQYGRVGKAVSPDDVALVRQGGPSSPLKLLARIGVAIAVVAMLVLVLLLVLWVRRRFRLTRPSSLADAKYEG